MTSSLFFGGGWINSMWQWFEGCLVTFHSRFRWNIFWRCRSRCSCSPLFSLFAQTLRACPSRTAVLGAWCHTPGAARELVRSGRSWITTKCSGACCPGRLPTWLASSSLSLRLNAVVSNMFDFFTPEKIGIRWNYHMFSHFFHARSGSPRPLPAPPGPRSLLAPP